MLRSLPTSLVAALVACGDNTGVPDAPLPIDASDAMVGMPDLQLVGAEMADTIVVTQATFTSTACEYVEACIDDVGTRRLLRFDTVTANLGTADLVLDSPPPDGTSNEAYIWSTCHEHHHLAAYAEYELRGGAVVVRGRKQAFCLQDIEPVRPGASSREYTCNRPGLSTGWADIYSRNLACQWIDITDVTPGTYMLHVRINVGSRLPDSDLTNNEWVHAVTL